MTRFRIFEFLIFYKNILEFQIFRLFGLVFSVFWKFPSDSFLRTRPLLRTPKIDWEMFVVRLSGLWKHVGRKSSPIRQSTESKILKYPFCRFNGGILIPILVAMNIFETTSWTIWESLEIDDRRSHTIDDEDRKLLSQNNITRNITSSNLEWRQKEV